MEDLENRILEQLTQRKREFEQALRRLLESQRETNDQFYGENIMDESDQAQREISVQNSYTLIERKSKELKMIEELIRKFSKEEICCECEECGEPIPLERLLIVPEARLCVPCQRESEKFGRLRNRTGRVLPRLLIDKDDQGEEVDEIEDLADNLEYPLPDSGLDLSFLDDVEDDEMQELQEQGR